MSFESKLEQLQKKSPADRRVAALVVTTVVFVPLMGFLMYMGAFSFSNDTQSAPVVDSTLRDDATSIAETLDRIGSQFIASTTASLDEIKDIASTTMGSLEGVGTTSTSSLSGLLEGEDSAASSSDTDSMKEDKSATSSSESGS